MMEASQGGARGDDVVGAIEERAAGGWESRLGSKKGEEALSAKAPYLGDEQEYEYEEECQADDEQEGECRRLWLRRWRRIRLWWASATALWGVWVGRG
jgi:hypothetical protein